jgi:hypothetical protein
MTTSSPITYNHNYNQYKAYPSHPKPILMPPRAVTTLNTYVPKALIKPAQLNRKVPRVYEKSPPRVVYTVPPVYPKIPPAPTTKMPKYMHYTRTNELPTKYAYNYNYSVNDISVSK